MKSLKLDDDDESFWRLNGEEKLQKRYKNKMQTQNKIDVAFRVIV